MLERERLDALSDAAAEGAAHGLRNVADELIRLGALDDAATELARAASDALAAGDARGALYKFLGALGGAG